MCSDFDDDEKKRITALAQHLIAQTTPQPTENDKNTPFALMMRFFDQIGNGLFNSNPNMVGGLLEEMINENPETMINPYYFFNFTRERPTQLGINEKTLEEILGILDKKLPPEDKRYPNQQIKAAAFLDRLKNDRLKKSSS